MQKTEKNDMIICAGRRRQRARSEASLPEPYASGQAIITRQQICAFQGFLDHLERRTSTTWWVEESRWRGEDT
jgi:hypothetical protein